MDPTTKSLLTTLLTAAFTSVATWLVSKGVISSDQSGATVNLLVGAAFAIGAAVMGWIKSREHTPEKIVVAASNVSGVQPIRVDTTASSQASPAVKALVANDAVPNVVAAKTPQP